MPSIRRALRPVLLSALLLTACGDDGFIDDSAGNTHLRFVAPIQFTDCDWDWSFDCGGSDDQVVVPHQCIEQAVWNEGEEFVGFLDLPPGECTFTVSIQLEGITCAGSQTFQVERGKQVMVDVPIVCLATPGLS